MPDLSDRVLADHAAYRSCTDGGRLAPESEGDLSQPSPPLCELAGHRYVIDILHSKATLACFRCDFSEYIGAWHPK